MRTLFYFASTAVILTAVLVALVSASAPPPEHVRIVVIDSAGTRLPSNDTIKTLRQNCARARIEAPSWRWSLFRPSKIALRCMGHNRNTGLPSTILWRLSDFGSDQAGHTLVLLKRIEANRQALDAYAAGYFLTAVLHVSWRPSKPPIKSSRIWPPIHRELRCR